MLEHVMQISSVTHCCSYNSWGDIVWSLKFLYLNEIEIFICMQWKIHLLVHRKKQKEFTESNILCTCTRLFWTECVLCVYPSLRRMLHSIRKDFLTFTYIYITSICYIFCILGKIPYGISLLHVVGTFGK